MLGATGANSHIYNPLQMYDKLAKRKLNDRQIYSFIAFQLRHSAAHSVDLRFVDALFAFAAIFKSIGIGIEINWQDPCPEFSFKPKDMIRSICDNACPKNCSLGEYKCLHGRERDILKKAMFLSRYDNLQTVEATRNHNLFRYLYFTLCFDKINQPVQPFFLNLIKSRFLHEGEERKVCPPFEKKQWVGYLNADGSVESSLGKLEARMFSQVGSPSEGKIYFHIAKKFLRD